MKRHLGPLQTHAAVAAQAAQHVANTALVLGNQRQAASVPRIIRGLHDVEPLVRGAAAWALAQIGGAAAGSIQNQGSVEVDSEVRAEIDAALQIADV